MRSGLWDGCCSSPTHWPASTCRKDEESTQKIPGSKEDPHCAERQLGRDDDDAGGTVTHFGILEGQMKPIPRKPKEAEGSRRKAEGSRRSHPGDWPAPPAPLLLGAPPRRNLALAGASNLRKQLAQACLASSCFKMVAPSLVMVTSPTSSTNILSSPCGPREDFRMLANASELGASHSKTRPPQGAPSPPSHWPISHPRRFRAGLTAME